MKRKSLIIIMIFIFISMIFCNTVSASHTASEVISEADSFISIGNANGKNNIPEDKLKSMSDTIFNILLVLAVIIAVIYAAVLGIKFMMSGIEGKAEVQKSIVPFVVGCVIAFGAFAIWKIIVTVLNSL